MSKVTVAPSLFAIDGELICGVDEAGRGPLAGPVFAAAVILDPNTPLMGLRDSKKLTAQRREELAILIKRDALSWSIAQCSEAEIDQLNIACATRLAMERAVDNLPIRPEHLLIDGIRKPSIDIPFTMITKGDGKSLSIAAASIIAKVTRDTIMGDLAEDYPMYHWLKNAGYGTALHQDALRKYGLTPHHRKSFAPIRAMLREVA